MNEISEIPDGVIPYYIIYNNTYYQSVNTGSFSEYSFSYAELVGEIKIRITENKLAYENFASNICPVGAKVYQFNEEEIVSEFWYQGKKDVEKHKILPRTPDTIFLIHSFWQRYT